MRAELEKKVSQAIRFLQSIKLNDGEVVEVCYSGGKDSDVILQLVKESGIPYRAIYKNTTIDPPGTIKHAMEMGAEVIRPKISFFHLMIKKGFPSRYVRHCCRKLKEYKILDKQIVGVRKSESPKRAKRYKEPEQCREYTAKEKARQYYPILYWTDEDVAEFIADRNIKCAPVYYDRGGNSVSSADLVVCVAHWQVGRSASRNLRRILKWLNYIVRLNKYIWMNTQN